MVIAISIPSALLAEFLNLPLAWFLGPMKASVSALHGFENNNSSNSFIFDINFVRTLYRNYIDKDLFSQIQEWLLTSLIMFCYIILSIFIVSIYLQKFSKYEKKLLFFLLLLELRSINDFS